MDFAIEKMCCSVCGFPLDISRKPILIDNNILSYLEVQENTCEGCGHQKDGSTIPVVYDLIQRLLNKKIDERERLIKFIHHYHFLTSEQKKEVCLNLPRFMLPKHNPQDDDGDIDEPFSWNVVWIEVINNTQLSKAMLNNIDWDKLNDASPPTSKEVGIRSKRTL